MQATVFRGNDDVRVEEVPDPSIVSPTDALVRITLSAVCGSDLHYYHAGEELGFPSGMRTGHECLGTVEAVGAEVASFRAGDRVLVFPLPVDGTCSYCQTRSWPCSSGAGAFGFGPDLWPYGGDVEGCQSELLRVPFADATLVHMPESVTDSEHEHALLTCIDNFATAWHGYAFARLEPGQNVLVIGDGGVGLCGGHAAKAIGAEQILLAGHHDDRLAIGERMGATSLTNSTSNEEVKEQVMEATGGEGVNVVLQTISGQDTMELSQSCVRHCGTIACVGMEQFVGRNAGIDWVDQWMRNITITGGIQPGPIYASECATLYAEGRIEPSPIFTHTLPLAEAPEGYRLMSDRAEGAVKVALRPGA